MIYRYKPKRVTNVVFFCFLFFLFLLTILRWIYTFHNNVVVFNTSITSHISNFSLSFLFYLAIGFSWLLQGNSFSKIVWLGIVLILANLLCETVMGFMNTPDLIDAVYGIVGTIGGFCF